MAAGIRARRRDRRGVLRRVHDHERAGRVAGGEVVHRGDDRARHEPERHALPGAAAGAAGRAGRHRRPSRSTSPTPPRSTPTSWRGETIKDQVESQVGTLDDETESITAIRRTTQPAGDERFPGSLKLPVLEVVGTAATEDRAEEHQRRGDRRLPRRTSRPSRTRSRSRPRTGCELEVLARNAAVEGETSNPAIPIVITGVAVFLAFVALALILGGIRSSREKRRTTTRRRDRNDADRPVEPRARTRRRRWTHPTPSTDREDDAERRARRRGLGSADGLSDAMTALNGAVGGRRRDHEHGGCPVVDAAGRRSDPDPRGREPARGVVAAAVVLAVAVLAAVVLLPPLIAGAALLGPGAARDLPAVRVRLEHGDRPARRGDHVRAGAALRDPDPAPVPARALPAGADHRAGRPRRGAPHEAGLPVAAGGVRGADRDPARHGGRSRSSSTAWSSPTRGSSRRPSAA